MYIFLFFPSLFDFSLYFSHSHPFSFFIYLISFMKLLINLLIHIYTLKLIFFDQIHIRIKSFMNFQRNLGHIKLSIMTDSISCSAKQNQRPKSKEAVCNFITSVFLSKFWSFSKCLAFTTKTMCLREDTLKKSVFFIGRTTKGWGGC